MGGVVDGLSFALPEIADHDPMLLFITEKGLKEMQEFSIMEAFSYFSSINFHLPLPTPLGTLANLYRIHVHWIR